MGNERERWPWLFFFFYPSISTPPKQMWVRYWCVYTCLLKHLCVRLYPHYICQRASDKGSILLTWKFLWEQCLTLFPSILSGLGKRGCLWRGKIICLCNCGLLIPPKGPPSPPSVFIQAILEVAQWRRVELDSQRTFQVVTLLRRGNLVHVQCSAKERQGWKKK